MIDYDFRKIKEMLNSGDKDDYDVSSIRSDLTQFNLQLVRDSAKSR